MLLGLFQSTDVKDLIELSHHNLIELSHHTPDVLGRKTAVLHRVDHIAATGIVTLRLGEQGLQFWIVIHRAFPSFLIN